MRNLLLGIGNTLRRDDGVGSYVAASFNRPGWKTADCGTAPENFSGMVREEHPDILVLVDAADMGLDPGAFSIIPKERIRDVGLGTHQLSLDIFIDFLGDAAGRILLVGIQPEIVETGEGLSPAVREGADTLIRILEKGDITKIGIYHQDTGAAR